MVGVGGDAGEREGVTGVNDIDSLAIFIWASMQDDHVYRRSLLDLGKVGSLLSTLLTRIVGTPWMVLVFQEAMGPTVNGRQVDSCKENK